MKYTSTSILTTLSCTIFIGLCTTSLQAQVRFNILGTEHFVFDTNGIRVLNTGNSIYLGELAGTADDHTDNYNIGIGTKALSTAGGLFSVRNIAIGFEALSSTADQDNIAIGHQALKSNSSYYSNIAIGTKAMLKANSGGGANIAIGHEALSSLTSGNYLSNTAIGYHAMKNSNGVSGNVALGRDALKATTGFNNVAVGLSSLGKLGGGVENVGVGSYVLFNNQNGMHNTAIGAWAGFNSNGNRNVLIGYNSGYYAKGDDKLYIENSNTDSTNALIFGRFDQNELAFNADVGIGTTNPEHKLHVLGDGLFRDSLRSTITLQTTSNNKDVGVAFRRSADNFQWNIFREGVTDDLVFTGGSNANIKLLTERMRILENNGYVGIGTGIPTERLHVMGGNIRADRGSTSNGLTRILTVGGARNANSSSFAAINLNNIDDDASNTDYVGASIRGFNTDGNDNGELRFYTSHDQALSPRMTISDLGAVGIGTLAPAARLHVAGGNVRIDRGGTTTNLTRVLTVGGVRGGSGTAYAALRFNNYDFDDGMVDYTGAQITSHNTSAAGAGDLRFLTNPSDSTSPQVRMTITHEGNVGVGTTTAQARHHVVSGSVSAPVSFIHQTSPNPAATALRIRHNSGVNGRHLIVFQNSIGTEIGSVTANGATVLYNTTSDRRYKANIRDYDSGLDLAMQMRPAQYEMKGNPGVDVVGVIAQEMYEVFPQAVSGTPDNSIDNPMAVDYSKLTPVLLSAIQELKAENDQLKAEMATVKKELAENNALRMENNQIQARLTMLEETLAKFNESQN